MTLRERVWQYLHDIPAGESAPSIALNMRVPVQQVRNVLLWLRECGLVTRKDSNVHRGKITYVLDKSRPYPGRHARVIR